MTNEELFGTILPNVYLNAITISGDLVKLQIDFSYSILESSNSEGINWTTLPPVVLNNLKVVVGLLKNDNTSFNERKIFSNFRDIRNPSFTTEINVSSFKQSANSSIVQTFPSQVDQNISDFSLPILESQPDLYKDSLIKKYDKDGSFTVPRTDLNNLDFYAFVFYDPPQDSGVQPIYGNLTKYKIYQNQFFRPEALIYNNIETGNEFFGLTLVKQNNNFLTSSVVDYSNENIELTESYVPFNEHSKKVREIVIADLTQVANIDSVVLNSKYSSLITNEEELPNYLSDMFVSVVSNLPEAQYFKNTTRADLEINGYIFLDADRLIKNRSFYPEFFNVSNPFIFSKENINIVLNKADVPKGGSIDSFNLNIKDVAQFTLPTGKKIYRINYDYRTTNLFKNKKGFYNAEVTVSVPDPVIKILTENKDKTNNFLNSLNSLRQTVDLTNKNNSFNEEQKKQTINNNLRNLNFSLDSFLNLMINLGINIDLPISGYERASQADITNFYSIRALSSRIFNNAININTINLNNIDLLINLTTKINNLYKSVITTGNKPANIEYKKLYSNIINFSSYNDNNIILLNKNITIGKFMLSKRNEKIVISSLPNFYALNILNNHLAKYYREDSSISSGALLPKFTDVQIEFINALAKVAPEFLDFNTPIRPIDKGTNETKEMLTNYFRSINKIFASNLTSVYVNFVSNILYKKQFLLGFRDVRGHDFPDMNTPAWVENFNGRQTLLTKLEKYNDFPQNEHAKALNYDYSQTKFTDSVILFNYFDELGDQITDEDPNQSLADAIKEQIAEQLRIEKQKQNELAAAQAKAIADAAALKAQQDADALKKRQEEERQKQIADEIARQAKAVTPNVASPSTQQALSDVRIDPNAIGIGNSVGGSPAAAAAAAAAASPTTPAVNTGNTTGAAAARAASGAASGSPSASAAAANAAAGLTGAGATNPAAAAAAAAAAAGLGTGITGGTNSLLDVKSSTGKSSSRSARFR